MDGYDALVQRCEIQAAESGFLQGASLPGRPTFTGDVTFFPKYQVLAANTGALDHLSVGQQEAVRAAALAVRDQALLERPSDADAAAAWCAGGGGVVLAGETGVAAFKAAAEPVYERLAADPTTATAITSILELRAGMTPETVAAACGPVPSTSPPSPAIVGRSGTPGIIPSGTYRLELTDAMLEQLRLPFDTPRTLTIVITGSRLILESAVLSCAADLRDEPDQLVVVWDPAVPSCTGWDRTRWILGEDGLRFLPLADASTEFTVAFGTEPFTRIE